jgi:hypothetical protein
MATQGTPVSAPERGGCLTIFLVLVIIGEALGIIGMLLGGAAMQQQYATLGISMPSWYTPVSIVAGILALVGAVGMWMWKRWGIYAMAASFVLTLIGLIGIGSLVPGIVGTAIAGAILWFVTKDKMQYFQ